ncbi:MAG: META domain-containing protein [Desulfobacter sp.]|nr:MAG: META domain-containing protein [Desulfobacter sp.]
MLLSGCAAVSTSPRSERDYDPQAVLDRQWQWESTITPVEKITADRPEHYTLLLKTGGKAQVRFDCNRGGGSFEISAGKLSFGPLISTRMACPPGSLDFRFAADLQRVASFFTQDNTLYLELPHDSGTMAFVPSTD